MRKYLTTVTLYSEINIQICKELVQLIAKKQITKVKMDRRTKQNFSKEEKMKQPTVTHEDAQQQKM